jgi:hypothetical protein
MTSWSELVWLHANQRLDANGQHYCAVDGLFYGHPGIPEFVIPTLGGICQHLLQRIAHCSII